MEVNPRFLWVCKVMLAQTDFEQWIIPKRASARGFDEKEVEEILASIDRNEISVKEIMERLHAWCDRYM